MKEGAKEYVSLDRLEICVKCKRQKVSLKISARVLRVYKSSRIGNKSNREFPGMRIDLFRKGGWMYDLEQLQGLNYVIS